jgi:dipeptidyl aminopeptidase/acylaminoacyl peptidase
MCLFLLLASFATPTAAQPDLTAKKVLTFADEKIWRSSSTPVLSADGSYIAYAVWPTEGDGETVIRHLASGKELKFPRSSGATTTDPKFTPVGSRVLLPLTPTKSEVEKAKALKLKPDEMPQPSLAVVDLETGQLVDKFAQAGPFFVAGEGAGVVIYRKPTKTDDGKTPTPPTPNKGKQLTQSTPPATGKTPGTDLHIRDLATKKERIIPEVSDFSLSRDRKLLVYTVAAKNEDHNGVFVLNPTSARAGEAIKMGPGRYSGLTWDEKQKKLAFLFDDSGVPDPHLAPPPRPKGTPVGTTIPAPMPAPKARYRAFVWDRSAKPANPVARELPFGAAGGFAALIPAVIAANPVTVASADEVLGPKTPGQRPGWTLSGGSLTFSRDGTKLFVNINPKRGPAPPAGPPKPDDFQLDLWHWKDERLQPMQKLQAAADQAKTYSAVVLLDKKQFRQLSDDTSSVSQPPVDSEWTLASDNRKYRRTTGYGLPLSDYAAVNIRTGEHKQLLPGFGGYSTPPPSMSPTGKHLAAFDGKDWFTVSVPDGRRTVLTKGLKVKFFSEEDDHPGTPPPVGQAQWTSDGKFLLVNDRYDIWKLSVDGSSTENLTKIGRDQKVRFTLLRVPTQDKFEPFHGWDLSQPQLLNAENLHTRDTGFYRLEPGAEPKQLAMGAKLHGHPIKARDKDVFLLTMQSFSSFPDYFTTTNFEDFKRVTDINPRVKEFNWGKSELVYYTSGDGVKLSGVLVKPENFDPTKKYPMVVYIYERLTQNTHNFRSPVVVRGQVINPTFYASNGYLVLMPDIAYKVGAPGQSALKSVLPAIQAVVDMGCVDTKAIGINGQSWGGYQIAYMVTQTDRFKAAVAGAPVSNMVSA